jgi:hypothetical protein
MESPVESTLREAGFGLKAVIYRGEWLKSGRKIGLTEKKNVYCIMSVGD